jgi:predicted helicase
MGYRADFEILLKELFQEIPNSKVFHDARAIGGNKPDFIVLKGEIPILYIEAKDIGVSLEKIEKSDQMSRYFGYANLILTDYIEFRFYRNGLLYGEPIKIAEYNKKERTLIPVPENFEYLAHTILDFTQSHKEPIKSGKHLAKIMGGKAQRIRDNVRHFLSNNSDKNTELIKIYETIKKLLVHDLSSDAFADMYAQTLVYGLFAARFYDESPENFTRQEARDLIPDSNPFLRQFFNHIVGPDFDKRLEYIVDELCEVFSHSDVERLMSQYLEKSLKGKANKRQDTVVHFYEDFLNEYDSDLRKKMGAYYTPLPVVEFIVRSVDELLKQDFGLAAGLADTSKLSNGKHKVQVLDPAVGTGTFISAVIDEIYSNFDGQKGRWPAYVQNDLLSRVHGFELMMAPYTIAHLKIGMTLKQSGFYYFNSKRLGVYLTNSLEESPIQEDMFSAFGLAESISEESKYAAKIKNDSPIMVVVGNPPYSVSSSNKGEWIQNLTKSYKRNLDEKNIQPLSDDYIKFVRLAEYFVEKNGIGIVAMITNNSFLDGIIHRKMREHLLYTFSEIYILNLHGNSKRKEKVPDGGKDENVFDIQQGVSINIFVRKNREKNNLGQVFYADLYGKRTDKFDFLNDNDLKNIKWKELNYSEPNYFYVFKDFGLELEYEKGFRVNELLPIYTSGVKTHKDAELVGFDEFEENNRRYLYRPFDRRWINYDLKKVIRSRFSVMKHMLLGPNLGLVIPRQSITGEYGLFVANHMIDINYTGAAGQYGAGLLFPLYLYHDDGTKIPNLEIEIMNKIEDATDNVLPEDIFDYIYAVLFSPAYREKYREFLKIDFPRVPYPQDKGSFLKLVELGGELRRLHLLESLVVNQYITTYPESGTDEIEKVEYRDNRVYINETQYFGNVPEITWNFYIGGYQPAQKWLKDRKGRILTNEEIEHYQQMIVALNETDKIMKEIDEVMQF